MINASQQTRKRINNDTRIRISHCNANDDSAVRAMMGDIKWWSLGRQEIPVKKKSFLRHLLEDDW